MGVVHEWKGGDVLMKNTLQDAIFGFKLPDDEPAELYEDAQE